MESSGTDTFVAVQASAQDQCIAIAPRFEEIYGDLIVFKVIIKSVDSIKVRSLSKDLKKKRKFLM